MKSITKKITVALLSFGASISVSFGQELVRAIEGNSSVKSINSPKKAAQPNFIYAFDTIHLPVIDDFSGDKFTKFDAKTSDADVIQEKYYLLYDGLGSTALLSDVTFALDSTYRFVKDSVAGALVVTQTALMDEKINKADFENYPIVKSETTVWPSYTITETKWDNVIDTTWLVSDLSQDSISFYKVGVRANAEQIWIDDFAYRNFRYGINPPTVGVATFDGVNETGIPYEFGNNKAEGVADYLTSKPIYLKTTKEGGLYTPGDSLYLSFYYQAQGHGDVPEKFDSLVVELYNPTEQIWSSYWAVEGTTLHDFKRVLLPITDVKYFQNGFQFRFKNYASLSGNLDHWNIDYVELGDLRSYVDTTSTDLAFKETPHSFINGYEAIPWTHYGDLPSDSLINDATAYLTSFNPIALLIKDNQDLGVSIDYKSNNQYNFNYPTTINYPALDDSNFDLAIRSNGYSFDSNVNDTCAVFDITYFLSTPTIEDVLPSNDTVHYQQNFYDYYSFDDGTAEAAVGPNVANGRMAYKLKPLMSDTLKAVRIHFEASVLQSESSRFYVTVWSSENGEPGEILFQNETSSAPNYHQFRNGFMDYELEEPQFLEDTRTYYIGFQQISEDPINVGFDRNNNYSGRLWYSVSDTWLSTNLGGMMMLRPVFKSTKQGPIGVERTEKIKLKIYPNPTSGLVRVETEHSDYNQFIVFDVSGREVARRIGNGNLDLSGFEAGMYLIHMLNEQEQVQSIGKVMLK